MKSRRINFNEHTLRTLQPINSSSIITHQSINSRVAINYFNKARENIQIKDFDSLILTQEISRLIIPELSEIIDKLNLDADQLILLDNKITACNSFNASGENAYKVTSVQFSLLFLLPQLALADLQKKIILKKNSEIVFEELYEFIKKALLFKNAIKKLYNYPHTLYDENILEHSFEKIIEELILDLIFMTKKKLANNIEDINFIHQLNQDVSEQLKINMTVNPFDVFIINTQSYPRLILIKEKTKNFIEKNLLINNLVENKFHELNDENLKIINIINIIEEKIKKLEEKSIIQEKLNYILYKLKNKINQSKNRIIVAPKIYLEQHEIHDEDTELTLRNKQQFLINKIDEIKLFIKEIEHEMINLQEYKEKNIQPINHIKHQAKEFIFSDRFEQEIKNIEIEYQTLIADFENKIQIAKNLINYHKKSIIKIHRNIETIDNHHIQKRNFYLVKGREFSELQDFVIDYLDNILTLNHYTYSNKKIGLQNFQSIIINHIDNTEDLLLLISDQYRQKKYNQINYNLLPAWLNEALQLKQNLIKNPKFFNFYKWTSPYDSTTHELLAQLEKALLKKIDEDYYINLQNKKNTDDKNILMRNMTKRYNPFDLS